MRTVHPVDTQRTCGLPGTAKKRVALSYRQPTIGESRIRTYEG